MTTFPDFNHSHKLLHLWRMTNTTLTRSLMSDSSSILASSTASFLPIRVMDSWSASVLFGKMMRAPVLSRTLRMFAPPRPIRNRWYSGFAFTSLTWLASFCDDNQKTPWLYLFTHGVDCFVSATHCCVDPYEYTIFVQHSYLIQAMSWICNK